MLLEKILETIQWRPFISKLRRFKKKRCDFLCDFLRKSISKKYIFKLADLVHLYSTVERSLTAKGQQNPIRTLRLDHLQVKTW